MKKEKTELANSSIVLKPLEGIKKENFEDEKSLIKANKPTVFCTTCKKVFKHTSYLENHIAKKHKSKNEKVFTCNFCDTKFAFKTSIRRHIQRMHQGKDISEMHRKTIKSEYGQDILVGALTEPNTDFAIKKEDIEKFIETKPITQETFKLNDQEFAMKKIIKKSEPNAFDNHITYNPGAEQPFQCKFCNHSFYENNF